MRAEPSFFGAPGHPRFGWLHRPDTPASGLGLLICNPFGYESICTHRSVRHVAEWAAAAGIPALRFDYDGAGDSAGADRDPDRVAAWVQSVRDAIDFLRRAGGVAKVCVLGIRFGALIGALAAAGRDDVAGFIALAPATSGKAYLRELRAVQMSMGLTAPPPKTATTADEREAVGFPITAETQAALTAVDLAKQDVRPADRVLLLDRDDLPSATAWADKLRAVGVCVEYERVKGFAESVLEPHKAVVPQAMFEQAIAWARNLAPPGPTAARDPAALNPTAVFRACPGDPEIKETATFLDDAKILFGVVTAPAVADGAPPPRRRGILMLNAGSIHHIGPNRLYVTLARRWAAQGHVVLRADVSGIGDSAPHTGEQENVVYTPHATADVRQALAFLRRQPGVEGCVVIGLCSGAYNAFKAAVGGEPIDAIVPINPLTFFWKDGMSLDFDYKAHDVAFEARRYSGKALNASSWKKVLRGEVKLMKIAQVVVRHGTNVLSGRAQDVARRFGHRFPDDLAFELAEVARRKIGLHFVFARDDPGLDILHMQGGRAVVRLVRDGKIKISMIEARGHTFPSVWAQDALVERLSEIVASPAA